MDENSNKDHPVTISAPPAGSVTVDPQNPLPEPSFFWRRILTFIVSFALLGIAWHNAIQLHDLGVSSDLLTFAKWCIALNGFVLLCYFIGPSAAEIISMIQSARIIQKSLNVAEKAGSDANMASERRLDRAEDRAGERFATSGAADSQIPEAPLSGAPSGSGGPLPDSDEIDAAPRSKQP
jgi:hypothetical protein